MWLIKLLKKLNFYKLYLLVVPGTIEKPTVSFPNTTRIKITWKPPLHHGGPPNKTWYQISLRSRVGYEESENITDVKNGMYKKITHKTFDNQRDKICRIFCA